MLEKLIPAISAKQLGAIDRACLLDDQYSLSVAGYAPIELVVKLLPAYSKEDSPAVWKVLVIVLNGLKTAMEGIGGDANDAFLSFARKIVLSALTIVGWESSGNSTENDRTKQVRALVISLVAVFCDKEAVVVEKARNLFNQYMATKDESILPADIKASVYKIVLKNGGQVEYDTILKTFEEANSDEQRKWALQTLGFSPSVELKKKVLAWSIGGDVKLQDCYTPMMSVASSGKDGSNVAWEFFKSNFENIKAFAGGGNAWTLQTVIFACTSGFSSEEKAADIEAFFKVNVVSNAVRKISQQCEKIRVLAEFTEKVKRSKLAQADSW